MQSRTAPSGPQGCDFSEADCQVFLQVAKSKSKTILVKMLSQAGTGYTFNTKRGRLREKLTLLRYDPVVNKKVLFVELKKIRSL
ncbi:large ribosomal subunit protein bL33m isoform X2 [Loxodonta africana]|uniref:39S ribosomal protein L33, mitochondrial isoform X2 n=1 Tax=Elephas maximus indicus TaxID=99487 RepID=UPI000C811E4A|nr:39S ribosomal protein L33, mitochondrial isoform X2 [Loxodonta africana]XP_049760696.1 39S ribosomal protein L33, mitochondrial isoform X2 [Elephas maximus indicus]XP_049760697.1 39S ribosomal protein L33, mitochondrial isoform X2 [Elephas maximus indicus]